jgi:hypothetical protein
LLIDRGELSGSDTSRPSWGSTAIC